MLLSLGNRNPEWSSRQAEVATRLVFLMLKWHCNRLRMIMAHHTASVWSMLWVKLQFKELGYTKKSFLCQSLCPPSDCPPLSSLPIHSCSETSHFDLMANLIFPQWGWHCKWRSRVSFTLKVIEPAQVPQRLYTKLGSLRWDLICFLRPFPPIRLI